MYVGLRTHTHTHTHTHTVSVRRTGRQGCSGGTKGPAVWEVIAKIASWQPLHHSQNMWLLFLSLCSLKELLWWRKKEKWGGEEGLDLQMDVSLFEFSPSLPSSLTRFLSSHLFFVLRARCHPALPCISCIFSTLLSPPRSRSLSALRWLWGLLLMMSLDFNSSWHV